MKKMLLLFFLLTTSEEGISQQNGWFVPGTIQTGYTLNDICAFDGDTAIAVGDNGTIIKTIDGGIMWIALSSGTSVNLKAVHFVNSKIGWVVGNDRTILKTTNGGTIWTQQSFTMSGRHCYDVFFIDADTGWCVCRDDWPGYIAIVYKTTNGGNNWISNQTGTSYDLYSLCFINASIGWAVGSGGVILKTTDGGSEWIAKSSYTSDVLTSVCASADQTLFAVGDHGTIITTTDGGENWSAISGGVAEKLLAVAFTDAQNGWIVGEGGVILHTADGGMNWGKQLSGTGNKLCSVSFVNSVIGWAAGQNGTVLKTTDNGGVTLYPPTLSTPANLSTDISTNPSLSWNPCVGAISYRVQVATDKSFSGTTLDQSGIVAPSITANGLSPNKIYYWRVNTLYPEGTSNWSEAFSFTTAGAGWTPSISGVSNNLRSVYFIDSLTGWAVGDGGTVLHTSNGGSSWNRQSIDFFKTLQDVFFINDSIGWTVGGWSTKIYKTTDGGESWFEQPVGDETVFNSVCFIDELHGWIVADYDIYGTTDGGEHWVKYSSINSDLLVDAQFLNATTGWIIGWNDIYKTTDGGMTWINKTDGSLNLSISEDLAHICLINENLGWVVSEGGKVFKTTNGDSWSLLYSCDEYRFNSIFFVDELTGWIVGENGLLLKSTDSGSSWGLQGSGTKNNLRSLYFINDSCGWVAGDNGIILKTKDGGGPFLPPIEDQPINPNGGFEEATLGEKHDRDIPGWTLWFSTSASATYKVVDNPVKEGNRALMVVTTALGTYTYHIQAVNEFFDVEPDSEYTYSVWIKADKNGPVVNFTVGDPSYNEWKRMNKSVTTNWQLVTFQFKPPYGASQGRAPIHFSDSANSPYLPVTYYIDDLQIVKYQEDTGIEKKNHKITGYVLAQNYPNPFNPETYIKYQLPEASAVKLEIYNLLGQKVITLVDKFQASGDYTVNWNGRDDMNRHVASGVYLYRLQVREFVEVRKLVLMQ